MWERHRKVPIVIRFLIVNSIDVSGAFMLAHEVVLCKDILFDRIFLLSAQGSFAARSRSHAFTVVIARPVARERAAKFSLKSSLVVVPIFAPVSFVAYRGSILR